MQKQPSPHSLSWAGIDLAKATFEAALWGHDDFRAMRGRSFPRCEEGACALLAWLRDHAGPDNPIGLVMEATATFAEELATWLLDLDSGLHIAIVNPIQTSAFLRSLGLRNKTDNLDAKALAQYGAERRPVPWEQPKPELAILKDLARVRMDLVHARTAMAMRLKDHARASKSAAKAMAKVIQTLDAQIKALEAEIRKQLRAHEALARQADRMDSIVGVGLLTAVSVMTELGDLHRFARSRQLTAFAGMSPKRKESGTSVHGKPRLCKQGSTRVRAALYLAASAAVRFNPDMKAFYDRLLAQGKVRRLALGAVMRKLLVLMRAVVKADHDWIPQAL